MPWYLETADGAESSRKLELKSGITLSVGQASGATHVFADDPLMSPVHFTVGLTGGLVRLQNLSQTNGTKLNGQSSETAVLQPGDRIQAGQTSFVVRGPAPSPFPAEMRLGGWGIESVPAGWDIIKGAGFRFPSDPSFRASVTAVEEPLPAGRTLADYAQTQLSLIRSRMPMARSGDPSEIHIRGAEQALTFVVITPVPDGTNVVSRQICALSSGVVGVFTATLLDRQEPVLHDALSKLESGLSYFNG